MYGIEYNISEQKRIQLIIQRIEDTIKSQETILASYDPDSHSYKARKLSLNGYYKQLEEQKKQLAKLP